MHVCVNGCTFATTMFALQDVFQGDVEKEDQCGGCGVSSYNNCGVTFEDVPFSSSHPRDARLGQFAWRVGRCVRISRTFTYFIM